MNNNTKVKLLAARAFAQEHKPAIARAILEATDDPKAQQMLARLPKQSIAFALMRLLTVLGVLILVAGTAYMIGYASAPQETVNVLFEGYQPTETPTPNPDATLNPNQLTQTAIGVENVTRIINLTETAVMREVQQTETAAMNATMTAISPETP